MKAFSLFIFQGESDIHLEKAILKVKIRFRSCQIQIHLSRHLTFYAPLPWIHFHLSNWNYANRENCWIIVKLNYKFPLISIDVNLLYTKMVSGFCLQLLDSFLNILTMNLSFEKCLNLNVYRVNSNIRCKSLTDKTRICKWLWFL